jgi:hypothetical protein
MVCAVSRVIFPQLDPLLVIENVSIFAGILTFAVGRAIQQRNIGAGSRVLAVVLAIVAGIVAAFVVDTAFAACLESQNAFEHATYRDVDRWIMTDRILCVLAFDLVSMLVMGLTCAVAGYVGQDEPHLDEDDQEDDAVVKSWLVGLGRSVRLP